MSEPTSTNEPTPPPAGVPSPAAPGRKSTWKYTLGLVALLVAAGAGYYFYEKSRNPMPPPVDELKQLKEYTARLATAQKLADGYADTDKDLVADPPKADEFLKVGNELYFTVVGTDDPEKAAAEWKDFMAALGKATRKEVKYLDTVRTIEDQFAAVREGKLHVTAFNTGAVPTAVNTAGFVPLFSPATADGKYGCETEILVRADAPYQSPADLKGKRIGFVALSSNSGAKAPLIDLKKNFEMAPGRDYSFGITGGHIRGVKDLIEGRYDAVCAVNDLLRQAEASGDPEQKVDKSKYRKIHTSSSFPPICFGVPHNLPPKLREQIEAEFDKFALTGQALTKRFGPLGQTRFARVNYKKDFEEVRKIDEELARLFEQY